jgi:hypothetical protein
MPIVSGWKSLNKISYNNFKIMFHFSFPLSLVHAIFRELLSNSSGITVFLGHVDNVLARVLTLSIRTLSGSSDDAKDTTIIPSASKYAPREVMLNYLHSFDKSLYIF